MKWACCYNFVTTSKAETDTLLQLVSTSKKEMNNHTNVPQLGGWARQFHYTPVWFHKRSPKFGGAGNILVYLFCWNLIIKSLKQNFTYEVHRDSFSVEIMLSDYWSITLPWSPVCWSMTAGWWMVMYSITDNLKTSYCSIICQCHILHLYVYSPKWHFKSDLTSMLIAGRWKNIFVILPNSS